MDELDTLHQLGFEWPSPAYLIGMLVFSVIGYAAWRYGRKTSRRPTMWIGVALMFYPYVVSRTWLLYVVGVALCIGIWIDHGR
jgi:MFS family permease